MHRLPVLPLLFVALAWALAPHASSAVDEAAPLVSDVMDDPLRITISGCTTYTQADLLTGLVLAPGFLQKSHPFALLQAYRDAVCDWIHAGYRNAGFPDTQVTATLVGATLQVAVQEGPRFSAGAVIISGSRVVPAQELVDRLVRDPQPTDLGAQTLFQHEMSQDSTPHPHWKPGTPPQLDEMILREAISGFYREHGYLHPVFSLQLQRHPETKAMDLRILVTSEGAPTTLDGYLITGNVRNTVADISRCLGFTRGALLDADTLMTMRRRLWSSGRFRDCTVEQPSVSGTAQIAVQVVEDDLAPVLSEPLPEGATGFLHFRDWLVRTLYSGAQDVVIHGRPTPGSAGGATDFVFNPHKGIYLDHDDPQKTWSGTLLLGQDRLLLQPPPPHRGLSSRLPSGQVAFSIELRPLPPRDPLRQAVAPSDRRSMNVSCNISFNTQSQGSYPTLHVRCDPVVFLHLFYQKQQAATVADHVESIQLDPDVRLRFRSDTGDLLEMTGTTHGDHGLTVVAQTAPHAFEDALLARRLVLPDADHVDHVMESYAGILLGLYLEDLDPEHLPALERAADRIARELSQNLSSATALLTQLSHPSFWIPLPENAGLDGAMGWVGSAGWALIHQLVQPGSWPELVEREAALAAAHQTQHTSEVLKQLYPSPTLGPLAYLTIAKLLSYSDHQLSMLFAQRGLDVLATKDFLADLAVFHELPAQLLEQARRISQDPDVCAALIHAYGAKAAAILALLRQSTPNTDWRALMSALWSLCLQDACKEALTVLAAPDPAAHHP
jgi:hypothetical protein